MSFTLAVPPLCVHSTEYPAWYFCQAPPEAAAGTHSISLTERFYCRPSDLFESLTDERRIRAYTQVTSMQARGFSSSSSERLGDHNGSMPHTMTFRLLAGPHGFCSTFDIPLCIVMPCTTFIMVS